MSIAQDVERYLRAGGRITILPGFQERPRRPHSAPPPVPPTPEKPRRERIPEWAQRDMVLKLMAEAQLLISEVSKESGVPPKRLGMHLDGTFNPEPADGRLIEEAVIRLATTKRRKGKT